ncbi:polysaccharide deacetylase [Nakamurella flavida]|uniref:Polysaccharide deacetylase n=1 Tax=Nakamurella flavida TaxID=363630 RepID=A0A938YLH8_9ACTN|nr:polysaccharide deacetylase [Nakamurella flavida]MBM9477369.1 polysaccharide deacetylase [Nakamurella flavida]MDP9777301.1 peptidoglycan/xylan/chitin deacetylase (PgdA/CDA1 family) [Nakamurella flavida]
MPKDIKVSFGVDVDAVSGWLGSYGGEDSLQDIQRGLFAGDVGLPRLVKLFDRYDLKATFFAPGHSIETFPRSMELVVAGGHEVGAHGYSHENPRDMSPQQEEDVLNRSIELIRQLTGRGPKGYIAPWGEMTTIQADLLLRNGISYDRTQVLHDFQPFYARTGDSWTKIDYAKTAAEWMHPLVRGTEIDLVSLAFNWYLDDLPPMMFVKGSPNSYGFANPRDIETLWRDQFDWVYREYDYATFPICLHPDVAGRPQVLLMIERLIEHMLGHEGVSITTCESIVDDFRRRYPFATDSRYPFDREFGAGTR